MKQRPLYSLIHAPMLGITRGNRYALAPYAPEPRDLNDDIIVIDDDDEGHLLRAGSWSFTKPRPRA